MALVEERLQAAGAQGPEGRRAHFVSALALARPGEDTLTYVGRVYGTLVWPPRGDQGFGYDRCSCPTDMIARSAR
jgi:XTP/dITP diphosphohydrolase